MQAATHCTTEVVAAGSSTTNQHLYCPLYCRSRGCRPPWTPSVHHRSRCDMASCSWRMAQTVTSSSRRRRGAGAYSHYLGWGWGEATPSLSCLCHPLSVRQWVTGSPSEWAGEGVGGGHSGGHAPPIVSGARPGVSGEGSAGGQLWMNQQAPQMRVEHTKVSHKQPY